MITPDPLFICTFPTGISYTDRTREEHGDYKRLGFLSFSSLILAVDIDCPPELYTRIREHATAIQARRGQFYSVSATGQCVVLGEDSMSAKEIDEAWLVYVNENPPMPLPPR